MKVLLSWLNEFGPFADPSDAEAVEAVAADLTSLGLAVGETIGNKTYSFSLYFNTLI